jgi:hypothetical protein
MRDWQPMMTNLVILARDAGIPDSQIPALVATNWDINLSGRKPLANVLAKWSVYWSNLHTTGNVELVTERGIDLMTRLIGTDDAYQMGVDSDPAGLSALLDLVIDHT